MASRARNIQTFERFAYRLILASKAAWLLLNAQFICGTDVSFDGWDY